MIERESVNLNIQTMQVMGSNVPDSTGSPMNVSSIVNFVIDDPVASKYNVENYRTFIHPRPMTSSDASAVASATEAKTLPKSPSWTTATISASTCALCCRRGAMLQV